MGRRRALTVLGSALLAVAVTLVGAACGGGGGGGPTEPPTSSLTFTASSSQTNNSLALARSNGNDPNALVLELRGRGVSDLYGVAFDLTYPASLRFDGATEGTWLNACGATQTSLQVATSGNRITVGLSRLGAIPGVSGDGTLLTLRFTAVAAGNGAIEFVNPEAFTSTTSAYTIQWIGGSVAVAR